MSTRAGREPLGRPSRLAKPAGAYPTGLAGAATVIGAIATGGATRLKRAAPRTSMKAAVVAAAN